MKVGTIVKTNKRNLMHKALKNQLFEIKDFISENWMHIINITTGTQYKFRIDEIQAISK